MLVLQKLIQINLISIFVYLLLYWSLNFLTRTNSFKIFFKFHDYWLPTWDNFKLLGSAYFFVLIEIVGKEIYWSSPQYK